jgi:ring-1,2-phenylacetyl-CoA epoxidase subunit PaaB
MEDQKSGATSAHPIRHSLLAIRQGANAVSDAKKEWPLWEVFVRGKGGLSHRHVGSVHATDAKMAIEHARDTYTRRMEGVSLWVVPSAAITASDPGEAAALFEPAEDKIYRHPTFYSIPDSVKHI